MPALLALFDLGVMSALCIWLSWHAAMHWLFTNAHHHAPNPARIAVRPSSFLPMGSHAFCKFCEEGHDTIHMAAQARQQCRRKQLLSWPMTASTSIRARLRGRTPQSSASAFHRLHLQMVRRIGVLIVLGAMTCMHHATDEGGALI